MKKSQIDLQVALVTGASSGIGRSCAERLQQLGMKVYAASRYIQPDVFPSAFCLPMNVNDDESVKTGITRVMNVEKRIDLVVNSAGFGVAGAIEDTSIEEAKNQFETNFFGVLRICRNVLPVMRQQQAGLIINISSLAGLTGVPFQGLYSASKYAIEGLTETLRMEVAPFGIHVVLIEPGDFSTGFTAKRQRTDDSKAHSVYQEACTKALAKMEHDEMHGPSPTNIAQLLEKIIRTPKPRLRYKIGNFSQTIGVRLKTILPHGLYEKMVMQMYGLE
jgi:NAD(P)-dependent dehydrogenase (short-subunit alcohol dehydrogenase family)